MEADDEKREEKLRILYGKRDYSLRVEMAELQKRKFIQLSNQNKINYDISVKKIKHWIDEQKKSEEISSKKLISFKYSDVMKDDIVKRKKEIEKKRKEICEAYSEESEKLYYIWITFNREGMIIVVGMSSFYRDDHRSTGDLFNQLGRKQLGATKTLDLISSTTEKIIVNTEFDESELREFDNILYQYKSLLDKLNDKLINYADEVLIIPVNPNLNNERENRSRTMYLEKSLGNTLMNDLPILNFYSHK